MVTDHAETKIWGVVTNDSIYINSFPYSKIKGYNLLLEKGYYSYFIGEPAKAQHEQEELGIIQPNKKQVSVCCKVGYVILPGGAIKFLTPELLLELCKDNESISAEIKAANLSRKDVYKMFGFLKDYNASSN